ncbi:hypothetical protein [Rickettsia endosymbiont of Ixodes pacificus]|uniref:hypothetical protein n=1 Tax=Rickettsia endosymbiont of Ixodes pacificus TaxID=1133329 RepID=UPI0039780529
MREHQVVIARKLRSNLRIFDEIATQPTAARHCCVNRKTHSVSYRGLTTVSKKQ